MNYAQFKQMENQATIRRVYSAMRGAEELDYLSDDLLWDICEQWIEQDSKESFEDFVDYYLEIDV